MECKGFMPQGRDIGKGIKERKVDIAAVSDMKKKLKGSKELEDYIMYYSGVNQEKRAAAGIALFIKNEGRDDESILFYQSIQGALDKINKNDYIILTGDFNTRVGNNPIKDVTECNWNIFMED